MFNNDKSCVTNTQRLTHPLLGVVPTMIPKRGNQISHIVFQHTYNPDVCLYIIEPEFPTASLLGVSSSNVYRSVRIERLIAVLKTMEYGIWSWIQLHTNTVRVSISAYQRTFKQPRSYRVVQTITTGYTLRQSPLVRSSPVTWEEYGCLRFPESLSESGRYMGHFFRLLLCTQLGVWVVRSSW